MPGNCRKTVKAICTLILSMGASISPHAQTMKWVPIPTGSSLGKCTCAATSRNELQCYALEYIPHVTGVMTSYTTAFLVSCTSKGSPVAKNESCTISSKVNLIDGCSESGKVMMISAGNTGSKMNSAIVADQPIYLHQVCFEIPKGETITIELAPNTSLTCAIDLSFGKAMTEVPKFISQAISHLKYDTANPTEWLDVKAALAGDYKVQLDWSVSTENGIDYFEIEHSVDGVNFRNIGKMKANPVLRGISVYQFTHNDALSGRNYYRIQLVHVQGEDEYSPVRMITIEK